MPEQERRKRRRSEAEFQKFLKAEYLRLREGDVGTGPLILHLDDLREKYFRYFKDGIITAPTPPTFSLSSRLDDPRIALEDWVQATFGEAIPRNIQTPAELLAQITLFSLKHLQKKDPEVQVKVDLYRQEKKKYDAWLRANKEALDAHQKALDDHQEAIRIYQRQHQMLRELRLDLMHLTY